MISAQILYPCKVALCSPQSPGEKTSNAIIRIIIIPLHPLLTLLCVSGTHADLLSHSQTHHPPCRLSRITQLLQSSMSSRLCFILTERRLDVGPGARDSTSKYLIGNTFPGWVLISVFRLRNHTDSECSWSSHCKLLIVLALSREQRVCCELKNSFYQKSVLPLSKTCSFCGLDIAPGHIVLD